MSGSKQIIVSREYRATPEACAKALALLLRTSIDTAGGQATAPENARKESEHASRKVIMPGTGLDTLSVFSTCDIREPRSA